MNPTYKANTFEHTCNTSIEDKIEKMINAVDRVKIFLPYLLRCKLNL